MDKKELLQQLMHMKKEYAKKCKRLQLAVRAKNAREHVRKKIEEHNELATDKGSLQEEYCNESANSPILLSFDEASTFSNVMLQKSDSCDKEKLLGKNFHSVSLKKQELSPIKNTNENVPRCSPLKEMTVPGEFDSSKNVDKSDSTAEIKIGEPLEKVSVCPDEYVTKNETEDSFHPTDNLPNTEINNVNSGKSTDTDNSESYSLIAKPKPKDFVCNDFVNDFDFNSSPPTIRRKRKHSASFREILPRKTQSVVEFHCDINQSSVHEKPKLKRRSYKKEEQNVILLSVLDYIIEEGKRNASFTEFQLPDSEYAHIKARYLKNNNSSRGSCKKVKNFSSCQSKTKTIGITKKLNPKENSESDTCLKKSQILKSDYLEELDHFQKHLPNLPENVQTLVPESAINTESCKLVSQNMLDSVEHDNSKNFQKCLFETESADTPKSISSVDSKAGNVLVSSEDINRLNSSKSFQKCLPFTKPDSFQNPPDLTLNHQPNTQIIRCSEKSQNLSDSLDHPDSRNSEKYLPETVDKERKLISKQTPNLESKTCSVDSQDILDSVDPDQSLNDKLPLFPCCNDGLSQMAVNSENHSIAPSISTDAKIQNISERWQNLESPTTSYSKTKDIYQHTKEDSPERENEVHCSQSKADVLLSNNKTDLRTSDTEAALDNRIVSSQHLSPTQSEFTQENKKAKFTVGGTSCDKSVSESWTQFKNEEKDLQYSHHSTMSPISRFDSDHSLPSNEDISKCVGSEPDQIATSSIVKTCVHRFSSSLCDSDKLNDQTFQDFKKAESFRLPCNNEEVVSLLNSRFCPGYNDFSPVTRDLLVCVTQYSIYFWKLTKVAQWEIVHQQQITELERCCHASLHPLQKGIGVATVLVSTEGQSQLVLHIFQIQEDMGKSHSLPVILPQIHKLIFSSLSSCSMAVARTSSDKTIDICKYSFSENLTSVKSILTLDFSSEKLLSLSAVQGLPAALLGFTATNIIFIWNHIANVLLTRISLRDIMVKSCRLPSAFTEQGHIVFPLIFDDGPEQGCLLAVNPNTDVVIKLLSYQRHLLPEAKSDSRMALILNENLLSVQDNVLGIWDLYSGCLLACVSSLGMTCMTMLHSNKEILLVTGHRQSCLHIYRSQPLQFSF